MGKQRLNNLSLLRVLVMLIVVWYHCLIGYTAAWHGDPYGAGIVPLWQGMLPVIASFHMSVFTILSGYLYGYGRSWGGYNNVKAFVGKKSYRVLIPYLFWGVVLILIQEREVKTLLTGVSHLWYLLFIYEAYLSFRLVDHENKLIENKGRLLVVFSTFVLLVANQVIEYIPVNILGLRQFVLYMPYYVIGVYIGYHRNIVCKNVFMTVLLVLSVIFYGLMYATDPSHQYNLMAGLPLSVSIFLLFYRLKISSMPAIIGSLDKCSMGIYILHHIFIQSINSNELVHPVMESHVIIYPIALFFVVLALSWVITHYVAQNKIGKMILG